MTSFIKVPFASSGDKVAVPDTDAGGGVNMTQGYGQAYSLDPATDPSAKRIERDKMNWLFNRITQAINEIQSSGVVPFITSADNGGSTFSYGKGALVSLGGVVYQSLVASNISTPPGANWAALPEKIQPLSATLTALASLVGSANKLPYFNGDNTAGITDLTALGRTIIARTNAADILSDLGLADVLMGDDATYAGFENGNVDVPYMRYKPTKAVIHLAKASDLENLQPKDDTLTEISGKTSAQVLQWLGMGDGHGRLLGVKVFTVSGTYTPDPEMKTCRVRAIGGGGGSGSAAATSSGQISATGGGAAGSYAEVIFTRSQIGASISATVGAAGTGGVDSNGGTGGITALGAILYCPGGGGSPKGSAASQSVSYLAMPGDPGVPATTTGSAITLQCGGPGASGISIGNQVLSGTGGSSPLGAGGALVGFSTTGKPGTGYGSGAGGVATLATPSNPGASGGQGVIIIEEYA